MEENKSNGSVCECCAEIYGARIPVDHCPTWWVGKCDLCQIEKTVTEIRDFGRDRYKIPATGVLTQEKLIEYFSRIPKDEVKADRQKEYEEYMKLIENPPKML